MPSEPAVPVDRRGAVETLYLGLDEAEVSYHEGVELISRGEEVTGEYRIANATNRIRAGARACANLSGCDVSRFLDVFDRLLTDQGIELKRQASRLRGLESQLDGARAELQEAEREPGTSPFEAAIPEVGRARSLLRGLDFRELIVLNGPVRAALDDWLTWMRPLLMTSYENYQFLRGEVAPIYEEAGLPEALLFAMMATETGVKVHSFSRAGAAGPLQFMRRTGSRFGLGVEDGFDTRLDPARATRAAVDYLNERFAELNDDLEKALAAYNGGETRVQRLDRKYRGSGFWDNQFYYSLPRETREYVPRILAAAWLFLHPEDYALTFPDVDVRIVELSVVEDIAIDELSICLGQAGSANGWFRTLRNLNPRLSPGDRVPAGESIRFPASLFDAYRDRCVGGSPLLAHARELHDANYPPETEMVPYVVQRQDTLGKIASRHRCVSIAELAALNEVRAPRYLIHVGQELRIPRCDD